MALKLLFRVFFEKTYNISRFFYILNNLLFYLLF